MKLVAPSDQLLSQAICLLSDPSMERGDVISSLEKLSQDQYMPIRLTDWIPECFALTVALHIAEIQFDQYFQAKTSKGHWKSIPLRIEPIVAQTMPISTEMFHQQNSEEHMAVASRSAILDAIENLLAQGGGLESGHIAGPSMLSVPAEFYRPALPWWIRIHWKKTNS